MNETHPRVFAWPIGLLVLMDGSLLFTDDANNQTDQIQYVGDKNSAIYCTLSTFSLIISSIHVVFMSALNP